MLQRPGAAALTALGSRNFARSVGLTRRSRAREGLGRDREAAAGAILEPQVPGAEKAGAAAGELSVQHHGPSPPTPAPAPGRQEDGGWQQAGSCPFSTTDLCPA